MHWAEFWLLSLVYANIFIWICLHLGFFKSGINKSFSSKSCLISHNFFAIYPDLCIKIYFLIKSIIWFQIILLFTNNYYGFWNNWRQQYYARIESRVSNLSPADHFFFWLLYTSDFEGRKEMVWWCQKNLKHLSSIEKIMKTIYCFYYYRLHRKV